MRGIETQHCKTKKSLFHFEARKHDVDIHWLGADGKLKSVHKQPLQGCVNAADSVFKRDGKAFVCLKDAALQLHR